MDKEYLVDEEAIWKATREQNIQEYSVPEMEEPEPEFFDTENVQHEDEYVSNRDVTSDLNMIKLNVPAATVIVNLIDIAIPILLMFVFKNIDKSDIKLEPDEKETLVDAFAQYLKTTSFTMSPGMVLITSLATIYGAKIGVAMIMNKKVQEPEFVVENGRSQSGT